MPSSACAFLLALALVACGGGTSADNAALRERLAYLENLDQVTWVDFDGGDVFIGFARRTADLPAVVNTAATVGYAAHAKPVHVYAVDGGRPGWRPGDGPVFCEAEIVLGSTRKICS